MKKKRKIPQYKCNYTVLDELMASATEPMPADRRTHQLTRMYQGLHEIETGQSPGFEDWRLISDAVNLVETLIHEMQVCEDNSGLLQDAKEAMAKAGTRHKNGGPLRLDGEGIKAVRAVLDDYTQLLNTLPARVMVKCHRLTERRLVQILSRNEVRPGDIIL